MRLTARRLFYAALLCVGFASALTSGCLLRPPPAPAHQPPPAR